MACARLIGRRHPLLLIDNDQTRLDAGCRAMSEQGFAVEGKVADISSKADLERLASFIDSGEPLGAIAHVAALGPSTKDWRRVLEVDLIGPYLVGEIIGPRVGEGGAVAFVASLAGYMHEVEDAFFEILAKPTAPDLFAQVEAFAPGPMTGYFAYESSKAAMHRLAQRFAIEWAPRRVRAVSVSPGLVLSEMGARERAAKPSTGDGARTTPLGRESEVSEQAAVIDFVLSDAASFINGVDLLVDGGLRAGRLAAQRRGEPGVIMR
jgi:NAD(P)-dependent dehydrogenase (short-subunit alcohol dehydrogenase family)